MTRTITSDAAALNVGQALELIEQVVERRRGTVAPLGRLPRIVSECLQIAGVSEADANRRLGRRLRDLYASREVPIRLTLGAALVLDAAQRCERLGFSDELILEHALDVASRVPLLVSDRVMTTIPSNYNPRPKAV